MDKINENRKLNFIKTNDKDTAELLLNLGFQKIDEQNGFFTFLNNNKVQFSDAVMSKIQFSNMLCI